MRLSIMLIKAHLKLQTKDLTNVCFAQFQALFVVFNSLLIVKCAVCQNIVTQT